MKLNKFIYILLAVFILSACETMEKPDKENSSVYPISGQWWVKMETESAPGKWSEVVGYSKLLTYNTASNSSDTIWISDEGKIWNFKVKCPIALSNSTFSMKDSVINSVADYSINVKVNDGFVSLGKAKSISGVTTDSISFKIGFTDDPGTVYRISGHRRTGFREDDPAK